MDDLSAWGFREWSWLVLMTATLAVLILAVVAHSALVAAFCAFQFGLHFDDLARRK